MSSEDIVSFEGLLRLPMRKVESHGLWLRSSAADKAPLAASVCVVEPGTVQEEILRSLRNILRGWGLTERELGLRRPNIR